MSRTPTPTLIELKESDSKVDVKLAFAEPSSPQTPVTITDPNPPNVIPPISVRDIMPYEKDEYRPPLTSVTALAACSVWSSGIIKLASLSLLAISGYFSITYLNTKAHESQPTLSDFQKSILLTLSLGANLKNILMLFPLKNFSQWFRQYEYRFVPFEWTLLNNTFLLLSSSWGKDIVITWLALRYGSFIMDTLYEAINKIIQRTPSVVTPNNFAERLLLLKRYCSNAWRLLILVSLTNIAATHLLLAYSNYFGNSLTLNVIIGIVSSMGYGGIGFLLGDWIENITRTINPYASSIKNVIYLVFGTLLIPGNTPYSFAITTAGGILQGWNSSHTNQYLLREEQSIHQQTNKIQQWSALNINQQFFDQASSYDQAHQIYIQNKRHQLKPIKYFVFAISLLAPLAVLWTPWTYTLPTAISASIGFLSFYYLCNKKLASFETSQMRSNFHFLFQYNPLIIAALTVVLNKSVYIFLSQLLKSLNYQTALTSTEPFYMISQALSFFAGSALIAPRYVRWWEQLNVSRSIDPIHFERLENVLSQPAPDTRDQSIPLTLSEVSFLARENRKFRDTNQLENFPNSNPREDSSTQSVADNSHGLFANTRRQQPTITLVKESPNNTDPDQLIDKTIKTLCLLEPILQYFPVDVGRSVLNF